MKYVFGYIWRKCCLWYEWRKCCLALAWFIRKSPRGDFFIIKFDKYASIFITNMINYSWIILWQIYSLCASLNFFISVLYNQWRDVGIAKGISIFSHFFTYVQMTHRLPFEYELENSYIPEGFRWLWQLPGIRRAASRVFTTSIARESLESTGDLGKYTPHRSWIAENPDDTDAKADLEKIEQELKSPD